MPNRKPDTCRWEGCDIKILKTSRYCKMHSNMNRSKTMSGEGNHMFGKCRTEEQKAKTRASILKKYKEDDGYLNRIKEGLKRKYIEDPDYFNRVKEGLKKHFNSPAGKIHREILSFKNSGERNGAYKDGRTMSRKYSKPWTSISNSIKNRDRYVCQNPNCEGKRYGKWSLDVHHIDENINNNHEGNLITLCRVCHLGNKWLLFRESLKEDVYDNCKTKTDCPNLSVKRRQKGRPSKKGHKLCSCGRSKSPDT